MADEDPTEVEAGNTASEQARRLERQPTVTPTVAVSVEWSDLSIVVKDRKRKGSLKTLLCETSGHVASGAMLAIMGPSGCGKTTMLDAIAGRLELSKVRGSVTFGGGEISSSQRQHLVSYVAQEDAQIGTFSVRETLWQAARFRYGFSQSTSQLEGIVTKTIGTVGLTSAAHTKVGDIFRKGLSGGQKRRLSLAIELINNPSVLVLDEPTSGLDSASAYGLMDNLLLLARQGHTVVSTIHQPSSDLFAKFDQLLLLSAGRTLYFGKADTSIRYFGALGYGCPQFANPADYFLGLINEDFPIHVADVPGLEAAYRASDERAQIIERVSAARAQPERFGSVGSRDNMLVAAHFLTLSKRNLINNVRNPGIFLVRLVMYAGLTFMIGFMYWDLGDEKDASSINSRVSILFFAPAFLIFMAVAVLPFFLIERPVFLRERANGFYHPIPFAISSVVCALPGILLITVVSSALVCGPAQLNGFGIFLLTLFACLFTAETVMYLIAVLVPHYIIGIALGAGLFGFHMLCQGVFKVKEDIPPWFIWAYWIGFHTYGFRAFMVNEFEPIDDFEAANGYGGTTGQDVLNFYGIGDADMYRDIGIVFAFGGLYWALYALILTVFHTGRR